MIFLIIFLALLAYGWAALVLSRRTMNRPASEPLRPWEMLFIPVGDILWDIHDWWFYSCPDCKQRFPSRDTATQHIIDRRGCTVPPCI